MRCVHMVVGVCGGQKRASGPLELELQESVSTPTHGHWELNLEPPKERIVLPASEPSLPDSLVVLGTSV